MAQNPEAMNAQATASKEGGVEAGISYYPTLLIGLGGTGAEVMLRVKKLLEASGTQALRRFLFIDADATTFANKPGLPPIGPDEQVLIGSEDVGPLLQNPAQHPYIWARFPKDRLDASFIRLLGQGKGAGQVRALGALAFVLSFQRVRQSIEKALNGLREIRDKIALEQTGTVGQVENRVAIYLAGSICGGTGSGCLLDTALVAKSLASMGSQLVAFLALPNASFDEGVKHSLRQRQRLRANAYAALREIQFVLDASNERPPVAFQYTPDQIFKLEPSDRLFDFIYLVDDENQYGRLAGLESLFTLMARTIVQDVGSPFGSYAQAFNANNLVLTGVDACPETKKKRLFGTVATSALVYPAERVASYVCHQVGVQLLRQKVLGAAPAWRDAEAKVTAFLQGQRWEERAPQNQLIHALLFDKSYGRSLSSQTHGWRSSWGQDVTNEAFANTVVQKLEAFEAATLPQVRQLVEENAKALRGQDQKPPRNSVAEAITQFTLEMASEGGIEAAIRGVTVLAQALEQMCGELQRELDDWRRQRDDLGSEIKRNADSLRQVKFAAFTKKDERLRAILEKQFNDMVDGLLQAVAKPKALEILKEALQIAVSTRGAWETLAGRVMDLANSLEQAARGYETARGVAFHRFDVEQEVTEAGYEKEYLENVLKQHSVEDFFTQIAAEFGGVEKFYGWLSTLQTAQFKSQLQEKLLRLLWERVAPNLLNTDLVDFVTQNPQKAPNFLVKLTQTFELCQPFWSLSPPQVGMEFPAVGGISVVHRRGEEGKWVHPQELEEWKKKNVPLELQGTFSFFHTSRPFEIVVSRRTYGARAYYLREAQEWAKLYKDSLPAAQGNYMFETHAAFMNIPDLFPDRSGR